MVGATAREVGRTNRGPGGAAQTAQRLADTPGPPERPCVTGEKSGRPGPWRRRCATRCPARGGRIFFLCVAVPEQDGSDESGLGARAAGAPARQVAAVERIRAAGTCGSCSPVEKVGLAERLSRRVRAAGGVASAARAAAASCGLSSAWAVGGVTGI
ncbi:hypothetical protein QJS66_11900 [Kocuria rhizophila]|nr:hypothetical protein QJS66_11900 [Kocuria rhizophila]